MSSPLPARVAFRSLDVTEFEPDMEYTLLLSFLLISSSSGMSVLA